MDKSKTTNKRPAQHQVQRQVKPRNNNYQNVNPNFRSLVCDETGIIVGEMVYRCLVCSFIGVSMDEVRAHHLIAHGNIEDVTGGKFSYIRNDNGGAQSSDCEIVTQHMEGIETKGATISNTTRPSVIKGPLNPR